MRLLILTLMIFVLALSAQSEEFKVVLGGGQTVTGLKKGFQHLFFRDVM